MGEDPARAPIAEVQRILQPTHAPLNAIQLPNGVNQSHSGGDEEPYTIRCICRFDEDDGNTVLCESCDTWQHIDCYFPNSAVPDVHMCVNCSPRDLDSAGAAQRQRHRLENLDGPEGRKPRRITQKGPKRSKAKDLNNIATNHTNGFAFADHKAGSPKDGGPPAKRHKTNHRSNNSLSLISNAHSNATNQRNRSESNTFGAGSPPTKRIRRDRPHDYYSPQFVQVHRDNTNFTLVNTNNHVDLHIAGLLSTWLDDPEAFASVTNGLTHKDVFQQAPSIEELEVPILKKTHPVEVDGESNPVDVPYLTVEHEILQGQLVGELRGLIGHQDEYKRDPANRWEELKHPQHFVFFHQNMPIYIDCRSEGTVFRYVRRSCKPNLSLKTFITDARDMRFCFTAEEDIPAGSEITIGWDTRAVSGLLPRYHLKKCNEAEMDQLHNWAETVLSNFGGCACDPTLAPNPNCYLDYLDRRLHLTVPGSPDGNAKPGKQPHKKRKAPSKKSPGAPILSNSRASSEAVQTADPEDDDSQSNSRSSKNSRDVSPNRPTSQDGRQAVDSLSARDRKKIIAQERLFEQMEQGEQGFTKRRKRNSGNQSTMSPISAIAPRMPKKIGQQVDSSTMTDVKHHGGDFDNPGHRSPKSRASSGDNSPAHFSRASLPPSPNGQTFLPRAPYADASTQTVDPRASQVNKASPKRVFAPLSKRLLKRSFERKVAAARHNSDASFTTANELQQPDHAMPSPREQLDDVEMNDVAAVDQESPAPPVVQSTESVDPSVVSGAMSVDQPAVLPTDPIPEPSAPPLKASKSPEKSDRSQKSRSQELRVELPPIPSFPSSGAGGSSDAIPSPQNVTVVQSPSTALPTPPVAHMLSVSPTPPVITPGGTQVPQQSPAKKKVSLSDYMQRMKRTPRTEKTQSQALEGAGGGAVNAQQQGGSSPTSMSETKTSPPPATAEHPGQEESTSGAAS